MLKKMISTIAAVFFVAMFGFMWIYHANVEFDPNDMVFLIYLLIAACCFGMFYLFWKTGVFKQNKTARLLIALIVMAVLPRILFAVSMDLTRFDDDAMYMEIAQAFRDNSFVSTRYFEVFHYITLLPYLLGKTFMLFLDGPAAVVLMNLCCAAVIVSMLFLIGRKFMSVRFAFLAGIVYCLYPSQIFVTKLFTAEMVYAAASLVVIYLIVLGANQYKQWFTPALFMAGAGMILSFANSMRPMGAVLCIAAAIYVLIYMEHTWMKKGAMLTSFVIGFLVINMALGSFTASKLGENGRVFPLPYTLYVGANVESEGAYNAEDTGNLSLLFDQIPDNGQIMETLMASYQKRVQKLGTQYPQLMLRKVHNFLHQDQYIMWAVSEWQKLENGGVQKETEQGIIYKEVYNRYKLVNDIYYNMLCIMMVVGCIGIFWKKNTDIPMLITIYMIGVVLLHAVIEVSERYRLTIAPLFCLTAVFGISLVYEWYKSKILVKQ